MAPWMVHEISQGEESYQAAWFQLAMASVAGFHFIGRALNARLSRIVRLLLYRLSAVCGYVYGIKVLATTQPTFCSIMLRIAASQ